MSQRVVDYDVDPSFGRSHIFLNCCRLSQINCKYVVTCIKKEDVFILICVRKVLGCLLYRSIWYLELFKFSTLQYVSYKKLVLPQFGLQSLFYNGPYISLIYCTKIYQVPSFSPEFSLVFHVTCLIFMLYNFKHLVSILSRISL